MFNQRIIILYINQNTFQIIGGNLSGIITIQLPDSVIRDTEVINKDGLYTLIKQWVKQYMLAGTQLIVILSEVSYFEKIFSSAESTQVESDILKFFDVVPYESLLTKVYPHEKGKRAVAINKSLYEAIQQGFSLQGVSVKGVIPGFTLGKFSVNRSLDAETASFIFKNLDSLIKQNVFEAQELNPPVVVPQETDTTGSKQKKRLPFLLGIFAVLIALLAVLVVTQSGLFPGAL
jgi:hypothetical protein